MYIGLKKVLKILAPGTKKKSGHRPTVNDEFGNLLRTTISKGDSEVNLISIFRRCHDVNNY